MFSPFWPVYCILYNSVCRLEVWNLYQVQVSLCMVIQVSQNGYMGVQWGKSMWDSFTHCNVGAWMSCKNIYWRTTGYQFYELQIQKKVLELFSVFVAWNGIQKPYFNKAWISSTIFTFYTQKPVRLGFVHTRNDLYRHFKYSVILGAVSVVLIGG